MSTDETLRDLIQFARKNNLEELVWKEDDLKVAFRRDAVPPPVRPVQEAVEPSANGEEAESETVVRSPMVGTFRRAVSKDRPPLVMIGNHIKPGDRLGVVECMKIPTDVVSYCAGEISQIMVDDGQTVEYGQPLFTVTPLDAANGDVG